MSTQPSKSLSPGGRGNAQCRGVLRSERLREDILDRISRLSTGDKLPGERTIAKETGLSVLTVNKVLATIVAEGLLERRPGRGTFVAACPESASTSKGVRLRMLRFFVRSPRHLLEHNSAGYIGRFYQGICEAANRDGIDVLPTCYAIDENGLESLTEDAFACQDIEGLFFVETGVPDYQQLWKYLDEGRRVVAFDFAAPERGLSSVLYDNVDGIGMAVRHCVDNGHTRIAYLGPAGYMGQVGDERLRGFRQGIAVAGLDSGACPVISGNLKEVEGEIREQLWKPPAQRPTAFVGYIDHYLLVIREVGEEMGLSVPEDISFVGFGDGLRFDSPPSISVDSICFDEVEMGKTAYMLWKTGLRGAVRRQPGSLAKRGSVWDIRKDGK